MYVCMYFVITTEALGGGVLKTSVFFWRRESSSVSELTECNTEGRVPYDFLSPSMVEMLL